MITKTINIDVSFFNLLLKIQCKDIDFLLKYQSIPIKLHFN